MQEYDVIVLGTGLKVRNLRQLFSAELHNCSIFFFLERNLPDQISVCHCQSINIYFTLLRWDCDIASKLSVHAAVSEFLSADLRTCIISMTSPLTCGCVWLFTASGVYPVRSSVPEWEEDSSHRQTLLLWRRECIYFSTWAGACFNHKLGINSNKGGMERGVGGWRNCCYIAVKWRVFPLQLYKRFKVEAPAEYLGRGKEWNIDLIPKFFLASGESMRIFTRSLWNILMPRLWFK